MSFIKKYHPVLFFSAWSFINFVQAANTVLLNDEAYYWVYSRFLDWGYFDHPPMIAVMIKGGYFLFKNELGVRFFIVIINTLTLLIIYNLLPKKNDILFYTITGSIALVQFGGFIAVPDIPLVFFTALFFMVYKNFVASFSWWQTFLLGVVMALLLYSKYHGVLVIICTLISNPALLKNKRSYVAGLITIILFAPHIYWQYQHGFPSVQYHLLERNAASYKISYTLTYIAAQVLLAGPLAGWLVLPGAFSYRPKSLPEKALKFSLAGIYIFFLISTLKGRGEANWTVPAMIPLIILSHQYFNDRKKWQRVLLYMLPFSLLLIFFLRFYLASDNKFITVLNTSEFEQDKTWAGKITRASGGLPVVFINSYQKASKYWFYSGIPAFSLNTPDYRRNNYNYWPVETWLQGKPVYAISGNPILYFTDSMVTAAGRLVGKRVDSFYSHSGVQLNVHSISLTGKSSLRATISLQYPTQTATDVSHLKFEIHIFQERRNIASYALLQSGIDVITNKVTLLAESPVKLPPGNYFARISILSAIPGYPSLNSTNIPLTAQ